MGCFASNIVRAGLASVLLLASPAGADVVDRVVAVVGNQPLLLSDLRHRAKQRLFVVASRASERGASPDQIREQLAVAEPRALEEALDDIVTERAFEHEAERQHVSVTAAEIDFELHRRAQAFDTTDDDLFAAARARGLSQAEYRDELRGLVLEDKLLKRRFPAGLSPTEADLMAEYRRLAADDVATRMETLVMALSPSRDMRASEVALARQVAAQARSGALDWCATVEVMSEAWRGTRPCGWNWPGLQPASLTPIAANMKAGEISEPIIVGDQVIIIRIATHRHPLPPLDTIRDDVAWSAGRVIDQRHSAWLAELRQSLHVEMRR